MFFILPVIAQLVLHCFNSINMSLNHNGGENNALASLQ